MIYKEWDPTEVIEYDYLKETDFCQSKAIKGPKVYKDLYEFQTQKFYTLDELNEDRQKRLLVRRELHKKMFCDFMNLLENRYPDARFTE